MSTRNHTISNFIDIRSETRLGLHPYLNAYFDPGTRMYLGAAARPQPVRINLSARATGRSVEQRRHAPRSHVTTTAEGISRGYPRGTPSPGGIPRPAWMAESQADRCVLLVLFSNQPHDSGRVAAHALRPRTLFDHSALRSAPILIPF